MGGGHGSVRAAARASAADREKVATRLRDACADERLSLETFVSRVETAYAARTRAELEPLVADLSQPGPVSRAVFGSLERTSTWIALARQAWRSRVPEPLVLPAEGELAVGRSHRCDVVLRNDYVSRHHARLRREEGGWSVEDCESRNGTWVNGRRIRGAAEVRPGDLVRLADSRFVLVRPHASR